MSNFMDKIKQRLDDTHFEEADNMLEKENGEVSDGKMLYYCAAGHAEKGERPQLACEGGIEGEHGEACQQGKQDVLDGDEPAFVPEKHPHGAEDVVKHAYPDAQQDGEQVDFCFSFERKAKFTHCAPPQRKSLPMMPSFLVLSLSP